MGSTKLIAGSDVSVDDSDGLLQVKAERGFEFWLKCEHLVCVTASADGSCTASAGQAEDSSTLCRKILTSAVIWNICLRSRSDLLLDVAIGEELVAGTPEV